MFNLIGSLLLTIYWVFLELTRNPKLFFNRRFIWKRFRKWKSPFSAIGVYRLENERLSINFILKNWYLRPNLKSLDEDTEAILKIKKALYNAICLKQINSESYLLITSGIKEGSKYAWEIIIPMLENMTKYFEGFRDIIIKMLDDTNGLVRETALLVMENGSFSQNEKKQLYGKLLLDKNKKVRSRAKDMIFREGAKFEQEMLQKLKEASAIETDPHLIEVYDYTLKKYAGSS